MARRLGLLLLVALFAANAGSIRGERGRLQSFLKRGGGIVVVHDALVGAQDPHCW